MGWYIHRPWVFLLIMVGATITVIVITWIVCLYYQRIRSHTVISRQHDKIKYLTGANEELNERCKAYSSKIKAAMIALSNGCQ